MLERAQDLVDKLYTMTAALSFTGEDEKEDDEIAAYVAMVDARAPLVEALVALRESITEEERATDQFAEIVRTIADIADLDNTHRTFFEALREEVRGSIKEVNQGRQINSAYAVNIMYDDYSRINKKN